MKINISETLFINEIIFKANFLVSFLHALISLQLVKIYLLYFTNSNEASIFFLIFKLKISNKEVILCWFRIQNTDDLELLPFYFLLRRILLISCHVVRCGVKIIFDWLLSS